MQGARRIIAQSLQRACYDRRATPMNMKRTAIVRASAAGALAALAARPRSTSVRRRADARRPSRACAGRAAAAPTLAGEIARLRERLRPDRRAAAPARNLFAFTRAAAAASQSPRRVRRRRRRRRAAALPPAAAAVDARRASPRTRGRGGPCARRSSPASAQLFLVKEGDTRRDRAIESTSIAADGVELDRRDRRRDAAPVPQVDPARSRLARHP